MNDSELEAVSNLENKIIVTDKLYALLNHDPYTPECRERSLKIETALKFNKKYADELEEIEKTLLVRLEECRQKLKEEKEKKNNRAGEKQFRYIFCGRPYFKDKSYFPAPDNEDTIFMRKSQMYDFSIVKSATGWKDKEKNKFLHVLLWMSQDKMIRKLKTKIAAVRRESKGKKLSSTNENKISALKSQIDMVAEMELKDVALPLDEEYDWDWVAKKLSYIHGPLEYKAFWKLYLHPTINKTPWTNAEHSLLLKIACAENLQNWKNIALILGTGRSGFQCFVYFRTHVKHPFSGKKWTEGEEEYLKRLIKYYRAGDYIPWGKVATAMDNRTKAQIYNKYCRMKEFRKGRFLREEDEVLLTCNAEFGANFNKMAKLLPGRSLTQCRNRFKILKKKSVSTVWSIDEDRKLVNFLFSQNLSINYSGIAQYFPNKDRQHIRSRCTTLRKWMMLNPNLDIAKAPRRASRNLGHGVVSHDLQSAIERMKTRIANEQNDRKIKISYMNLPESDIDDSIIQMLRQEEHEQIEEAKWKALTSSDSSDDDQDIPQFNSDAQNLRKNLLLLRVSLEIKKFIASPLSEMYKGLLELDHHGPVVKIKSYSRKKPDTIVNVDSAPDIWGTQCLPPLTYVFPPNYSTITALRTIMSATSAQSKRKEETTNINKIFKDTLSQPYLCFQSNCFIKTDGQDYLFKERFKSLFLWSIILSNQPPEPHDDMEQKLIKKTRFANKDNNALQKFKKEEDDNIIDLEVSASTSTANLSLKKLLDILNFDF